MIWINRLPKLLRRALMALPPLLLGVLLFAPAALAQAADAIVPQTGLSVIEQWWLLATFLPNFIGVFIGWYNRFEWSDLTIRAQNTIAVIVYVAFACIGSALDGKFEQLAFGSVREITVSIMAVVIIGYTSYQTLWKTVPFPQWLEAKSGGDPLVPVVPGRNAA